MRGPLLTVPKDGAMICVHKLKGEDLWVNPDLIAFVEPAHTGNDTLLTLTDGRHLVIADAPADVAERVRLHRARVLALAFRIDADPSFHDRHLHVVPRDQD